MNPQLAAGIGTIVVFIGKSPGAHQPLEVGDVVLAQQIIAVAARLLALVSLQDRAPLRERRDEASLPDATILLPRQQHPRIARMHRERHHLFSNACKFPVKTNGSQIR